MHYQNPIFLTQLRNNGIIPVQDEQVRCNDTDQFQCTAAIDNMVVDLQKGPESSTMVMSFLHLDGPRQCPSATHVLQIWALQMFI